MTRPPRSAGFTLIEMLTVMAVIAILAGLILSVNGLVQSNAAKSRAKTEIQALSAACENFKAENGSYPQDTTTDALDARATGTPSSYAAASLSLYKALSGDANANNVIEATEGKSYAPEYFRPDRLSGTKDSNGKLTGVKFIVDPFGNSYGYSTAGAKVEQDFQNQLRTNPNATRSTAKGYNPTFDLWSTAGKTEAPKPGDPKDITATWVKNW